MVALDAVLRSLTHAFFLENITDKIITSMDKERFDIHIIETLQDFLNYKQECMRKEEALREFEYEDDCCCMVAEDCPPRSKRLPDITFEEIIKYAEGLGPESINDAKAIALMLYTLVGYSESGRNRIRRMLEKISNKGQHRYRFGKGARTTINNNFK